MSGHKKTRKFLGINPGIRVDIPGLDPGIKRAVWALRREGIWTSESCEGGPGHTYPEPTVAFSGSIGEGFRALEIVLRPSVQTDIGLQLHDLRRVWSIVQGEPEGPYWELTWWSASDTLGTSPGSCPDPRTDAQAQCPVRQGMFASSDTSGGSPASPCDTPAPSPEPEAQQTHACKSPAPIAGQPSSPSDDPSGGDA